MSSVKIVVANQKGGVGKTTTCVTVAHGLALKNHNVLIVDLDPQGQCASHLGMSQEGGVFNLLIGEPRPTLRDVVRTTGRQGLYVLPGNKRTASAQTLLAVEGYDRTLLARMLNEPQFNSGKLHYIVLDTSPSVGGIQEMALYAADIVIIPTALDFLSLEGAAKITQTIQSLDRPRPPLIQILPTFYDEVTKESAANLNSLKSRFGPVVLDPIHRAVVLRECPSVSKTIFEYCPNSRAATEYGAVVWGVLDASR